MPVTAIFCRLLIFKTQIIGIGMHKMKTSVANEMAPVARALVEMLEHSPPIDLSQKKATGMQANTLTMNVAMAHMPVTTNTPYAIRLNSLVWKIRV